MWYVAQYTMYVQKGHFFANFFRHIGTAMLPLLTRKMKLQRMFLKIGKNRGIFKRKRLETR